MVVSINCLNTAHVDRMDGKIVDFSYLYDTHLYQVTAYKVILRRFSFTFINKAFQVCKGEKIIIVIKNNN